MNEQTDERDMGNKKEGKFARRVDMIRRIAIASSKIQAQDEMTFSLSITAGVIQGLNHGGGFKAGVKTGVLVYGIIIGSAVVFNLSRNAEAIKDA